MNLHVLKSALFNTLRRLNFSRKFYMKHVEFKHQIGYWYQPLFESKHRIIGKISFLVHHQTNHMMYINWALLTCREHCVSFELQIWLWSKFYNKWIWLTSLSFHQCSKHCRCVCDGQGYAAKMHGQVQVYTFIIQISILINMMNPQPLLCSTSPHRCYSY